MGNCRNGAEACSLPQRQGAAARSSGPQLLRSRLQACVKYHTGKDCAQSLSKRSCYRNSHTVTTVYAIREVLNNAARNCYHRFRVAIFRPHAVRGPGPRHGRAMRTHGADHHRPWEYGGRHLQCWPQHGVSSDSWASHGRLGRRTPICRAVSMTQRALQNVWLPL